MAKPESQELNRSVLDRLMRYYHYLNEHINSTEEVSISSARLAQYLSLDDSQIRKDLAAIGVKGHCHVGFNTRKVLEQIECVLGFKDKYPAVVIGAGRLGGAISSYEGFSRYGLNIIALFDIDPSKIGLMVGGHVVQPLEQLEAIINQSTSKLGILTVPAQSAQASVDRLVKAGIKVIWNFSPGHLQAPEDVLIRNESLFVALAELFYYLKRNKEND